MGPITWVTIKIASVNSSTEVERDKRVWEDKKGVGRTRSIYPEERVRAG